MKKDKNKYHSIHKPDFIGGKKGFQEFLAQNLVYPKEALENKAGGIAHVKCEIDDRGHVIKAEAINKLGFNIEKEAERLCLLMKFGDTTERGLRIKHTRTIRIPFVLPKPPAAKPATLQINYQTTPSLKEEPKTEEPKTSYTYTIKF